MTCNKKDMAENLLWFLGTSTGARPSLGNRFKETMLLVQPRVKLYDAFDTQSLLNR